MAAPAAYRKEVREIPPDAWYTGGSSQGNLSTWTEVSLQSNTDTNWKETGTELR